MLFAAASVPNPKGEEGRLTEPFSAQDKSNTTNNDRNIINLFFIITLITYKLLI
jgi:hypothetical protein